MKNLLSVVAISLLMALVFSSCSGGKKPAKELMKDELPSWNAADIELVHQKDTAQYVSDPDGFILPQDKGKLNKLLKRLEKNSQIRSALVVVGRAKSADLNGFAEELEERYATGNSNRDMIIVVSVENRQWGIYTGKGMGHELPDSFAAKVMNEKLMPHMERNNPNQGVVEMCQELYSKLNKKKDEEI